MSSHRERRNTPIVSKIVADEKERRYFTRHAPSKCLQCTKGQYKEVVVPAESLRIQDDQVDEVVTYKVKCPYSDGKLYEKLIGTCYSGTTGTRCEERCDSCRFGKLVIVMTTPAATVQRYIKSPHISIRELYRCTNPIRMEQFNKEKLIMCAYMHCDQYQKKG